MINMITAAEARGLYTKVEEISDNYLKEISKAIVEAAPNECNIRFNIGNTHTYELAVQKRLIKDLTNPKLGFIVTASSYEVNECLDEFFLNISW